MLEKICVEWIVYVNVTIFGGKVVSVKFDRKAVDEEIKTSLAIKLRGD